MQHIMNLLAQVQQLQLSPGIAHRSEASHQFPHSGTVEVIDIGEIENDLLLTVGHQAPHRLSEFPDLLAENDPAFDVQNGDMSDFARVNLERHDLVLRPAGPNGRAYAQPSQMPHGGTSFKCNGAYFDGRGLLRMRPMRPRIQ